MSTRLVRCSTALLSSSRPTMCRTHTHVQHVSNWCTNQPCISAVVNRCQPRTYVRRLSTHAACGSSRCFDCVSTTCWTTTGVAVVGLLTRSRSLFQCSCRTATRLHRVGVQKSIHDHLAMTASNTAHKQNDKHTSSSSESATVLSDGPVAASAKRCCEGGNTMQAARNGSHARDNNIDEHAEEPGTQIITHSVRTACRDLSAPSYNDTMPSTSIHNSGARLDGGAQAVSPSKAPCIVATTRDVIDDVYLHELANSLEERRVERHKKMFDNMIVFEGGCLSDHEMLGDRLIMRDFVHFALYHKKWGYYPKLFRKYRQWMTSGYFDPIPFAALRNQHDFERCVAKIHESTPGFISPTQLFQPYYGWVLAEYLITTMRAKFDPREPLVVYDVGAGTGALALSILDNLAENFSAEYARCEYHVLEQNPHLIQTLRNKLVHHYHHVHIHHLSVLNWRALERRRCVVIAVELMSSMPHDCIVWDGQGCCNEEWIVFAMRNNLATALEKHFTVKDPIILRYLRYLNWMQEESFHHLQLLCITGGRVTVDSQPHQSIEMNSKDSFVMIVSKLWWVASPFNTAWLPTTQMLFLELLAQYFPRHHLFAVDWSSVRQGLPGVNGPVVQVKMRIAKDLYLRRPLETFCNNAGMNDLCFPTNFEHLGILYKNICGDKDISCMSHPEFWRVHGGDKSALFTTHSGFNPLLEDFSQLQVFASHHPAEF